MSRIRSIHPGLWTDEVFVSLSPFARLLFMGIWNECDDKGTFPWSPLTMKMRILPADNVDACELMAEIEAAGAVCSYEIAGKKYGAVRNFTKFQRPKKPNDIHPVTPEIRHFIGIGGEKGGDEVALVPNRSPTDGENPPQMEDGGWRMEEREQPDGCSSRDDARDPKPKRKAAPKSKPKLTRLAEGWRPDEFGPDTDCRSIVDGWPPGELKRQIERFTAHHTAKGSRFENWQAAWKTWVLNSRDFGHGRQANGNGHSAPRDRRDGVAQALDRRLGLDETPGASGRRDAGDGRADRGETARLPALR